jgi:hypothetical protein
MEKLCEIPFFQSRPLSFSVTTVVMLRGNKSWRNGRKFLFLELAPFLFAHIGCNVAVCLTDVEEADGCVVGAQGWGGRWDVCKCWSLLGKACSACTRPIYTVTYPLAVVGIL